MCRVLRVNTAAETGADAVVELEGHVINPTAETTVTKV
jgi:hypothetical protein